MLVALELAGWLNESNLALQAVVQCYGLLAPLIYFKIPSTPVIQVIFVDSLTFRKFLNVHKLKRDVVVAGYLTVCVPHCP